MKLGFDVRYWCGKFLRIGTPLAKPVDKPKKTPLEQHMPAPTIQGPPNGLRGTRALAEARRQQAKALRAQGLSETKIAEHLEISKTRVRQIFRELRAREKADATTKTI